MDYVADEREEAVIGRMQIDNYLMGVMRKDWPASTTTVSSTPISELVDATVVGREKGKYVDGVIYSNRHS